MKFRLPKLLLMGLLAAIAAADAATYSDLSSVNKDEANHVYYNGQGTFYVESAKTTALSITIDLNALSAWQHANDYSGISPFVTWSYDNNNSWGLADYWNGWSGYETTNQDTYEQESRLVGYWVNKEWKATESGKYATYEQLSSYADSNGLLTIDITSTPQTGGGIVATCVDSQGSTHTLYNGSGLFDSTVTSAKSYTVNTNYVTSVTINTTSTLDVMQFQEPVDYSKPFVSERHDAGDKSSLGRVMFLGDSITNGVEDMTWRWQLFKTMVDNGIENEIAGPLSGYSYNDKNSPVTHTSDYQGGDTRNADTSYAGVLFTNEHYAQSSGRTYNMINGGVGRNPAKGNTNSGVAYGGNSSAKVGAAYNADTYMMMMGTNDLLSDTDNGNTTQYSAAMANMLGGTFTYTGDSAYSWTPGAATDGTMGTILQNLKMDEGDKMYIMSVPCWTAHGNHGSELDHATAAAFNGFLQQWVENYNSTSTAEVVYVDINRGLIDLTESTSFYGNVQFFHRYGDSHSPADGLHPNEQGSLIIAGNLAQAMGIGGRTAGLKRSSAGQDASAWQVAAAPGSLSAGSTQSLAEDFFSIANGYTVDFSATVGNGQEGGWADSSTCRLDVGIGDGAHSGTLSLTEGYIMWGDQVLFCQDNHLESNDSLRIAYHNGNTEDNVASGYYVWLGDMLIGQGLSDNSTGDAFNGITITSTGGSITVGSLSYANTAYAPVTSGIVGEGYTYSVVQDVPMESAPASWHNNTAASANADFSSASASTATYAVATASTAGTPATVNLSANSSGWFGATASNYKGDIAVNVVANSSVYNAFAVLSSKVEGNVTMVFGNNITVNDGSYSGNSGALLGTYQGSITGTFSAQVDNATLKGNIIMGVEYATSAQSVGATSLVLNKGAVVQGSVYGGNTSANGTINGDVSIVITGGRVNGSVYGGGNAGNIAGNTSILLTGGIIQQDVNAGNAAQNATIGGSTSVTIASSKVSIGGNITADTVTIKDVTESGYQDGFDNYDRTITAKSLVLDNVQTSLAAKLADGFESITVQGGCNTSLTLGAGADLTTLVMKDGSTVGFFLSDESTEVATEYESTLLLQELEVWGSGATLNANIVMSGGKLTLRGNSLALGSSLDIGSGMVLDDESLDQLSKQGSLTLFTGVDTLLLDGEEATEGIYDAGLYFQGMAEGMTLVYADAGTVSIRKAGAVPEPATCTLALLALAGLCGRRRRK